MIGSILFEGSAFFVAKTILKAEDFDHPVYRAAWSAAELLAEDNIPIDAVTIADRLHRAHLSELLTCAEGVFSTKNLEHHARIVRDCSLRRRINAAAHEMIEKIGDVEDVQTFCTDASRSFIELAERSMTTHPERIDQLVYAEVKKLESIQEKGPHMAGVISTGYSVLDKLVIGLEPKDLILLGARPSMGKTAWAIQLGRGSVHGHHDRQALFFSMEMSKHAIVRRALAQEANVSISKMREGQLDYVQWQDINRAVTAFENEGFWIDDTKGLTPLDIRAKCRAHASKHGPLSLIIGDYAQLVKPVHDTGNTHHDLGETAVRLKDVAAEFGCPFVLLSQLSREVERRQDKRPTLSDLRESGTLEEAADVVFLLYRDEYYHPNSKDAGMAELIIGKQRNGPRGYVKLNFNAESNRFW